MASCYHEDVGEYRHSSMLSYLPVRRHLYAPIALFPVEDKPILNE